MGFFSRRRKRESAISDPVGELGSFAGSEGQPVVGEQVEPGQPVVDLQGLGLRDGLAALSQLGPLIEQAMVSGNPQVSVGEPAVIDMRGSGLREEILGIMGEHGIDPQATNPNVDASAYGEMQQQILEALAKHGIAAQSGGSVGGGEPPPAADG